MTWGAAALLTACAGARGATVARPTPPEAREEVTLSELSDAPVTAPALPPGLPPGLLGARGGRHRLLHFTFDDGPRPHTTPRLLTHLARYHVQATFFVVTRALEDPRRRETARRTLSRMAREGHTVGLHGHDHTGFRHLSDRGLTEQLQLGSRLVAEITERAPTLVRPPYGGRDRRTDRVVARMGLHQVLWSMTPERPRHDGQEAIVDQFRSQLAAREEDSHPGTVVLLHDTRPWVVEAFPRIMRHVQRRNCQLLASGAELWDVVPSLEALQASDEEVAERQAMRRAEAAAYCARHGFDT
ncbi:MAG: polysaccharide deacetylase family protein [Sandaracinaceae bacterium]|nr:polysaccharide deacetylase family protein [Sandaracinaceae bacterium]